jgi:outer membrane protein assembly factor BamB
VLTLLRQGAHISELTLQEPYTTCRMGRLQTSITVLLHNVGTERLTGSDLEVWGYYRLALDPPADEFAPLVVDANGAPVQLTKIVSLGDPGDPGFILITLNYDIFNRLFAPSSSEALAGDVLGKGDPVQLRITVRPTGSPGLGGTQQDLYLPDPFALSQFFSTVDLWTYPERSSCCSGSCGNVPAVTLEPAVAGGLVFHETAEPDGYWLHVLKVRTGEEKDAWKLPSGGFVTAPLAIYDSATQIYRVYVGSSDGKVYALEGHEKEEGSFLSDLWQGGASMVSGLGATTNLPTTYLGFSADRAALVVGSVHGAYVLDPLTGQALVASTNHAPVTARPAYSAAGGILWYAADEIVYGVRSNGTECTFDVADRISTPLLLTESRKAVLFGTETGYLYALDAASTAGTCTAKAEGQPLRTIVGMEMIPDGDDAVVYLTSDIGQIARVEYDEGRGFKGIETSERKYEPTEILTAPALLVDRNGNDASIVFVSGTIREGRVTRPVLQGWQKDLRKLETVTVWSSSVSFLFKPKESSAVPQRLLAPIVDQDTYTVLVASSDGYLYAFDLGQFE